MREFQLREMSRERAHQGYVRVQVTEFDGDFPVKVAEVLLHNSCGYEQCDCIGDHERFAKCEHTALAKTWRRQGRPTGTWMSMCAGQFRVYTIDEDGLIGYYKAGGKHVNLSNWRKVLATT